MNDPVTKNDAKASETPAAMTAADAVAALTQPSRAAATAAEQSLLAKARRLEVLSAGRRLAAWIWGEQGPAVLLVHGWDSRASHLGLFVESLLADGYRVAAFDAPAHGDSEGSHSNVVDIGRAVLEVAEQLGPLDTVVGHSVGSPACLYAFAQGLRVGASVHLAGPSSLKRVLGRFAAMCRLPDDQLTLLQQLMAEQIGAPLDAMELENLAAGLRHPALLLHDPDDREVPFSESQILHAAWPQSVLQPMPGTGHRRIVRDNAAIEASVRFLSQQLSRRAS
ncbi:MAG TPA: alpha/beta hydrolase [Gammaproteobacteria bacterium]|nr:alpha/beta hydrolase [Gammaproteobacteria bacterium]